MEKAYSLTDFESVSKIAGEKDDCLKYIKENGGTLYTQVDGDDGDIYYVEGDRLVNRTGWYGVA